MQLIFQTANVNLPSEADEPIAGPEGFAASVAFGVADELEDEEVEVEVEELPDPPAAPIAPRMMNITTTFCQVLSERNFSQMLFKKPNFTP